MDVKNSSAGIKRNCRSFSGSPIVSQPIRCQENLKPLDASTAGLDLAIESNFQVGFLDDLIQL